MNGWGHSSTITFCAARASLWSKITLLAQRGKQPEMLLFCKYTAYRVSHCITEYHWQSQSKYWPRQKGSWTYQLWRHHIVHRGCCCHVWALQAIINVPAEDWKVLGEAVSVLCQQGSLDPLHKILKPAKDCFKKISRWRNKIRPGHHGCSFVCLLRGNYLVPQVLMKKKIRNKKKYFRCFAKDHLEVIFIEEDKAQ